MRLLGRTPTLAAVLGAGAVCAVLAGMLAATGPAAADPPTTPAQSDIVGVAGDTLGPVLNQIATDYNAQTSSAKVRIFDATGASPIVTKTGCYPTQRPSGSSTGINALSANQHPNGNPSVYCVDFSGSSRAQAAGNPGLAFVPFARDAVTWSKTSRTGAPSNAPASLSNRELKAIYQCDASILGTGASGPVRWNQVGGTSTANVVPLLPPADSGVRSFFLGAIGVTTLGNCGPTTTPLDNEGTDAIFRSTSSPNIVFPYSVAAFLAQSQNGHGTGTQGSQVLGSSESSSGTAISPTTGSAGALTINPYLATVALVRNVYIVVRDTGSGTHVPIYLQPLVGADNANGYICANSTALTDVKSFGFQTLGPRCGMI